MFLIVCDKIQWYMVCQFYRIVLCSITVSSYPVTKGLTFANVSDYSLDDIFVIVCIFAMSLAEYTVLG